VLAKQVRLMNHLRIHLLADMTGATLSVLFFEFLMVNISLINAVKWDMVIFDSITGIVSYSVVLILLKERQKFLAVPMIFISIILSTAIWTLCHTAYLIYFDWRYLSDIRPESFYERNITGSIYGFLFFVPY
jgi:hypothetical protein